MSSDPSNAGKRERSVLRAEIAASVAPQANNALELALTRVFVRTAEPMAEGAVLTVGLTLADGVRLNTMAVVVARRHDESDR